MEERKYSITHLFFETDAFNTKHGKISELVRDDLYFYLMLGRGKLIDDTGGLKVIRCEIEGPSGKEGRDVVFADYNCPHIRVRIYYLLVKYPPKVIESLDQEQKNKLRILKEKVDEYIRRNYG